MKNSIGVIIQARRGSSRLKDKVCKNLMGKPLLYHILRRVQQSKHVNQIIVATTINKEDRLLEKITRACNVPIFYGSNNDVLDRYYQAAKEFCLSNIVRITADCPVIDPCIIDRTIDKFRSGDFEYVSNCLTRTFPEGMSVEVFSFAALEKAWNDSVWLSEREHVTPYIWKNPEIFRSAELLNESRDQSYLRLTVDFPKDFELIRNIYRNLFPHSPYFLLEDILRFLEDNPKLVEINKNIPLLEGYLKSLKNDKIVK